MAFLIRRAAEDDRASIWAILEPVIRAGETYPLARDMERGAALDYWMDAAHEVFVAEEPGEVFGTYYIRPNNKGGGAHVANCGYMTGGWATGRGVAREMCRHSIDYARRAGYRAIQFNFVVATNVRAVALWQSCGFKIVGRLPGVFEHPVDGDVDALVMFQAV